MKKILWSLVLGIFLLSGVAYGAGDNFRSAKVFSGTTVNATGTVTAGWDWTSMDCDGPFSIDYSATSGSGTPDVSIYYKVLNQADGSTVGTHTEWDGTDNGELTTASNTNPGNVAQGLPFTPPVNAPGTFSVTGVGSNPADTAFTLSVQCYRR